ncbi:hypothetical protein ALQ88_05652, partial [Pseudomonas savastanoi]
MACRHCSSWIAGLRWNSWACSEVFQVWADRARPCGEPANGFATALFACHLQTLLQIHPCCLGHGLSMRVLLVFLLSCAMGAFAVWRGWVDVPARWNPWAPLDVRAEPNFLTSYKLSRLHNDPALCDQVLSTSGLRFSRQADSEPSARCPLENTLRIQGGDVALSSSFLASCPLAVAYALFDIHTLQPAAQAVF